MNSSVLNLWTVSGGEFGSGHLHRIKELDRVLRASGWEICLHDLSCFMDRMTGKLKISSEMITDCQKNQTPKETVYNLIDLRDIDPSLWGSCSYKLFLDNQNPGRYKNRKQQRLLYHDTIPHPKLDLMQSMKHLWFSNELIHTYHQQIEKENTAIFYSGSLPCKEIQSHFLEFQKICENAKITNRIQIGKHRVSNDLEYFSRLPSPDFYVLLAKSQYYFSYYGLGIFEAMLVGTIPVLYEISSHDHQVLSDYICENLGVVCLKHGSPLCEKGGIDHLRRMQQGLKILPGILGQTILLSKIREFFVDESR